MNATKLLRTKMNINKEKAKTKTIEEEVAEQEIMLEKQRILAEAFGCDLNNDKTLLEKIHESFASKENIQKSETD